MKNIEELNKAIFDASESGHESLTNELITQGADVPAKNRYGYTALHLASYNGYTEAALTLISHGANTSQANGKLKNLTMHQAAAQGGFTSRVIELLRQNSSILSQDAPETLADYARRHEKHDTAAAIQSFIASQAIDFMLKNTSPSTIFSRNQKS